MVSFFMNKFIKTKFPLSVHSVNFSYQLSTINYQLSTINYQLSTINQFPFKELFPAFATRFFEVSAMALPPPKPQKELRHAAQSGLKYRSAILTFSVKYLNSEIYYLQHS